MISFPGKAEKAAHLALVKQEALRGVPVSDRPKVEAEIEAISAECELDIAQSATGRLLPLVAVVFSVAAFATSGAGEESFTGAIVYLLVLAIVAITVGGFVWRAGGGEDKRRAVRDAKIRLLGAQARARRPEAVDNGHLVDAGDTPAEE